MNALEQQQRERVIAVAREFLGTKYHDCAKVKGPNGGVDCATLLSMVYEEAGVVPPIAIPHYSPMWMLSKDAETYMEKVLEHSHEVTAPLMADVALYKLRDYRTGRPMGKCFSHGAIVVSWPDQIIHAHKGSKMVTLSGAFEADLHGAAVRFFSAWD